MRKVALAVMAVMALSASASFAAVSGWIEQRTVVAASNLTPTFDGILFKNGTVVNTFCYFLAGPYSETYVGPRYTPTSWSEFGAGLGVESSSPVLVKGGYVWLGRGRWSAAGVIERGAATFLKWEGNYQPTKFLTIGWWQQSGLGAGPRLQLHIPHAPTITAMHLQRGSIVTIRTSL